MITDRILLTTPTFPYPTLPPNESLTDAMGQRFTHGDGMFSLRSHTHCYANHILAQNINRPAILLEYPRWKHFTKEVDKKYALIGISAFPVHLDTVIKMCLYIREKSPDTQIVLGSYAAQSFAEKYDKETQKKYVDHVVLGEGVRFLRRLLGEDPENPMQQKLMPKCGGAPFYLAKFPKGNVGFLVSGLGCPGTCDFCSTNIMFGYKRLMMLSPDDLVQHIQAYFKNFPHVKHIFVIEEDHFRQPEYLIKMRDYWQRHPKVMERLDWFAFGSVDHIGAFADKYGWEAIGEIGIGAIFIGVESKFGGEQGLDKLKTYDARKVFDNLHKLGIRTVGAWICGWDFHDHTNIDEDLNYFVACYPTYQQITRLSPFPGTVLYQKAKEEHRVRNVPWEDVHFWSGALVNSSLESHETLNLTEYGYDLMVKTWGPSLVRRFDVVLNGYENWIKSSNPIMRNHKTILFKQQAGLLWCTMNALDRFAPNGVVRRRIRKLDERYRKIIGEPTPVQKYASFVNTVLGIICRMRHFFSPINRFPKEEPFKRYTYKKDGRENRRKLSYTTRWPGWTPLPIRLKMGWEWIKFFFGFLIIWIIRLLMFWKSDPVIDKYIIEAVRTRSWMAF
jgi:hypothetical protein